MSAYSLKIIRILIHVIKVRGKGKKIIAEEYRCEILLMPLIVHQNFVYFPDKYIIFKVFSKIGDKFVLITISFQIKLAQGETYES